MKTITLKNFQSHKNSVLNLSKGINAIVGNSDCGKSAVMRGILWAITNKPSGDSFISNSIKDSKGKIKGECSVSIDGVARIKSKEFNGYVCGQETYEALRTDVPTDISEKFNISDVNIQRQMDGAFMLSNTPGENAKFINELVNLEVIDTATSWVSAENRTAKSNEKVLAESIETQSKKLYDDNKIEHLSETINKLNSNADESAKLDNAINDLKANIETWSIVNSNLVNEHEVNKLSSIQERCELLQCQINYLEPINKVKADIDAYQSLANSIPDRALVNVLDNICCAIVKNENDTSVCNNLVNDLQREVEIYENLSASGLDEKLVTSVEAISDKLSNVFVEGQNVSNIVATLSNKFNEYNNLTAIVNQAETELQTAMQQISTMACPLCGHVGCQC